MHCSTMTLLEKEAVQVEDLKPADVFTIAERVSPPLKTFLEKNTDDRVSGMFVTTARRIWPEQS